MNKINYRRYIFLSLAIITMLFIFFMSAQNSNISSNSSGLFIRRFATVFSKEFRNSPEFEKLILISKLQGFFRKAAHFCIYFFLGFSLSGFYSTYKLNVAKYSCFSLLTAALYAATDELHQLLVAGRSGELADVLLDSFGALFGILLFIAGYRIFIIIRGKVNEKKYKQALK